MWISTSAELEAESLVSPMESRRSGAGACRSKASETLPPMAPCWEFEAGAAHAGGQLYNWVMLRRWGPVHGMYGTLDAELEVQRTIKRAEVTALLCLLTAIIGHGDNKGIINGLWRGEMKRIGPKARGADLWFFF